MKGRVTIRSPRPGEDPPGSPAGSTEAFRREVGGLARGGLLNLGSSAASQLAMLVLTIVLARVLGREAAGVYFQAFAFLSLLSLLSLVGFRGALTRFVAMHLADDDIPRMAGAVRLALCISVPASVTLAGGLFVAAPWLARSAFQEPRLEIALRLAAVTLPAVSLQEAALSATQGFRTMKPFALVGLLLEPLLRLALSGALLAAGFGLRGTLVALAVSSWIGAAVAVTWLRRLIAQARESCPASGPAVVVDARPFLRYSAVAWVASLASTGLIWADTIILGLMVTSSAVGVYNASARLVTLAVFVVNPI
ncbi:MAG TPA: oligosaccharide flippase family protein, partial [Acidimicrobiales bacterium]|nr:oligosaccharide flippase family protein [Acidimicrobiales bacterium]